MNNRKVCCNIEQFKTYFLSHNYNKNMFNIDGSINPNYNSNKKTGIIAQIFEDHWNRFYKNNKIKITMYRPNAPIEIQKIIDSHNKSLGCTAYECPKCSTRMNFMCVVT